MKRYTVYVSDEDAERIEPHKHLFNVSEVSRNALLEEVRRLEGVGDKRTAVALRVVERIKENEAFKQQRETYDTRRAERLDQASDTGAELVASLLDEGELDVERLAEIDSQPPQHLPSDIDRRLMFELSEVLGFQRVPDEYRHAARAAFRETVHLLMER